VSDIPFQPPRPPHLIAGFTAGVLRLTWEDGGPWDLPGRGLIYPAAITECLGGSRGYPRDFVIAAIVGLIIQLPNGDVVRIRGVESHCLNTLGTSALPLGILVGPVDE
jgi:hypothetical protein